MGYSKITWSCLNKYLRQGGLLSESELPPFGTKNIKEPYYEKEMLELGCQTIRGSLRKQIHSELFDHNSKDYFESIGIKCLSIDIKGCKKSLIVDITKPMHSYFYNKFDIITNSGTTEHIFPLNGQYLAFNNIHLCTKLNGIMIHFVPVHGVERKPHGYFNYDENFFETLAELNNYRIIKIEKYDRKQGDIYWGVCLRKTKNNNFTIEKEKFNKNIKKV